MNLLAAFSPGANLWKTDGDEQKWNVVSGACVRNDRNERAVVRLLPKFHHTVGQRIQGIVLADANIETWVVLRATLANENVARDALLTTENFHAQSLRVRLPAVFRATYTFFVSHGFGGLCGNVRDFDFRQRGAETVHFLVTFPALLFEDQNFVAFEVAFYLGGHFRAAYRWGANLNVTILVHEKN